MSGTQVLTKFLTYACRLLLHALAELFSLTALSPLIRHCPLHCTECPLQACKITDVSASGESVCVCGFLPLPIPIP